MDNENMIISNDNKDGNVKKSKKIKCSFCKKKCTMINFECDCGGIFCVEHKCGHSHNCKIIEEKKEKCKQAIEKGNPKTESKKMVYIN